MLILIFTLLFSFLLPSAPLEVKLSKMFDIGKKQITLSNNVSLAEDHQGHIYVMDSKLHKIFKFSDDGKFICAFGQEGQGPGDIYRPQHIAVSEKNQLIITDAYSVSVLDLNGKCLEKYNTSRCGFLIAKKYAGGNKILAKKIISRTEAPPLVLATLVPGVKVINDNVLEYSSQELYKEAGIFHESISPEIWYAYSSGRSVVAISESYVIKIINDKGMIERTIKKDVKNPPLSKKERDFIIETRINQWREIDQSMKNGLKKTIPHIKTLITGITLSKNMIFVRRVREDITDINAPEQADVYSINGDFPGTIRLKSFPIFATDRHFYFQEETEDGEIFISKYFYKIIFEK